MKKVLIILAMGIWMISSISLVLAGEESWSYYLVKKGDTLSEITWYFKNKANVPEEKWTKWNPEIGMRNLKSGDNLRYQLPKDLNYALLEQIKKETQNSTESIGQIIQRGDREIKETMTDGTDRLLSRIDKLEKGLKSSLIQPVLFSAIIILLALLILLRTKKDKKMVREIQIQKTVKIPVRFEDRRSFWVNCLTDDNSIFCPICPLDKQFENENVYEMGKHLKLHHKHDEGHNLFVPVKERTSDVIPIKRVVSSIMIVFILTALFLTASCGGKYVMSQGQINKVPELKKDMSYMVFWCKLNRVLLLSEPGLRHDLYFENDKTPMVGVADPKNPDRLMVICYKKVDLDKTKAMVVSRSGKHFYPVDGNNVFSQDGFLALRFDWNGIKPLSKSNIQIWEDIKLDSNEDKEVKEILQTAGKSLDQLKVPGLFDRVMARVIKITTDDVILAGATDFHSLFGLFGVRLWALVEAFIQKADLSLPYYDTALMDRFQWALSISSVQRQLDSLTEEQKKALQAWLPEFEKVTKELEEYRTRKAQRDRDYQGWLKLKQRFEQNQ